MEDVYVRDSAFKITLYLPSVFYCIAATFSAVFFLGLLLPLLIQLSNGTFKRIASQNTARNRSSRGSRIDGYNEEKCYSSYNLYLIYLCFMDLLTFILFLVLNGIIMGGKFNPVFNSSMVQTPVNVGSSSNMGLLVTYTYIVANVWINCFILYQIISLFRNSKSTRRVPRLTLKRVNAQMGAAFLIAWGSGLGVYFHGMVLRNAINDGDSGKYNIIFLTLMVWSPAVLLVPIGYAVYAAVSIWMRGYIASLNGSSASERALRELAYYLFRIIMVFFGIWVPGLAISMYAIYSNRLYLNIFAICLFSIQPVATFCVVLTKSDARQYILDLVTLSYLWGKSSEQIRSRRTTSSFSMVMSSRFKHESSAPKLYGDKSRDESPKFFAVGNDGNLTDLASVDVRNSASAANTHVKDDAIIDSNESGETNLNDAGGSLEEGNGRNTTLSSTIYEDDPGAELAVVSSHSN